MRRRLLLGLSTLAGLGLCAAVMLMPPTTPAVADTAPKANNAQSQALYAEKCSACHNLPDAQAKAYTRAEWQRTVNRMLTKYNASESISSPQAAQIVDYLATFAPKPDARRNNGHPGDQWATDDVDVWTTTPSATHVFQFMPPFIPAGLTPLPAGTPGPAPRWQVVPFTPSLLGTVARVNLVSPSPSRFALLTTKDAGRNVDVKVRFQIRTGKISPAIGLAFGLSDPKTYSVLRYDQAHDTLSLIQVAEPTHTTLQMTALNAPIAGDTSLASTAPPPAPADQLTWHTLRLLVNNGQVRGWIDGSKRISIAAPANYTGGKVGLWAQGDTVAIFDNWTVDYYDTPATPPAI